MRLVKILEFGHQLLEQAIEPGAIVIDATCGNGHDTKFLAKQVGPSGKVFAFDIQKQAIAATTELLRKHQLLERVTLLQKGHEYMKEWIPVKYHGKISAGVFNLGYLPGGDHSIITRPETTLKALQSLLDMLALHGVVVLVVYPGHPGGDEEKNAVCEYVSSLDQKKYQVLLYRFINQKNHPPLLFAIEKIKDEKV